MKIGDIVKSKATGYLYKVVCQREGREGYICAMVIDENQQYYFFDDEVEVVSEN